jgi:hypothetical protein
VQLQLFKKGLRGALFSIKVSFIQTAGEVIPVGYGGLRTAYATVSHFVFTSSFERFKDNSYEYMEESQICLNPNLYLSTLSRHRKGRKWVPSLF